MIKICVSLKKFYDLEKQKGPLRMQEPFCILSVRKLLQVCADVAERVVELRAEALNHGDDGDRDAGSDQAVLDCSGAGLVAQERLEGVHLELRKSGVSDQRQAMALHLYREPLKQP